MLAVKQKQAEGKHISVENTVGILRINGDA